MRHPEYNKHCVHVFTFLGRPCVFQTPFWEASNQAVLSARNFVCVVHCAVVRLYLICCETDGTMATGVQQGAQQYKQATAVLGTLHTTTSLSTYILG